MIEKNRLIAVTDAILAVAATIMVLRLDIPEIASLEAIRDQHTILIAYLISFTMIFLSWHEHHDIFLFAEKINHRIMIVNCLWLFAITLIPFVTGVVGNSPYHKESLLLYIFILFAEQLVLLLLSSMVEKLNNITINDSWIIKKLRIITIVSYAVAALSVFINTHFCLAIIVAGCVANIVYMCICDAKLSR